MNKNKDVSYKIASHGIIPQFSVGGVFWITLHACLHNVSFHQFMFSSMAWT